LYYLTNSELKILPVLVPILKLTLQKNSRKKSLEIGEAFSFLFTYSEDH